MIAFRDVLVHAQVQITRDKIRVLGRDSNSQTDFVDSQYVVTFSGSSTPHKINLQDLEDYQEVKGIFQSDYDYATVTFAWGGQPRPEEFTDPTPENKYYSFELRRRQKSEQVTPLLIHRVNYSVSTTATGRALPKRSKSRQVQTTSLSGVTSII